MASASEDSEALRWATTRIVLEPGGTAGAQSGTLHADRLS